MPAPLCSTDLRSITRCAASRMHTSWLSVAQSIPTKNRYCSDKQPPNPNLSVTQHRPCTGALRANSPQDVPHGPRRQGACPPQALCRRGQLALLSAWSAPYWLYQFGSDFKGTGRSCGKPGCRTFWRRFFVARFRRSVTADRVSGPPLVGETIAFRDSHQLVQANAGSDSQWPAKWEPPDPYGLCHEDERSGCLPRRHLQP